MNKLKETWDLDVFFPGGSESEQFHQYLNDLQDNMTTFKEKVEAFQILNVEEDGKNLVDIICEFEKVASRLRQAGAFVSCLEAQNTSDKKAAIHRGTVTTLQASLQSVLTELDEKLTKIEEDHWQEILKRDGLKERAFNLNERRSNAKEKLPRPQEDLLNLLSIDGYHGWGQMYDTIVGSMEVVVELDGKTEKLSVGQASNRLSDPNRDVRKAVFHAWEKAWAKNGEFLSKTLNHLAGFRLKVYEARNWTDVLKEPLNINRMKKETLDVMWQVISENKTPFVQFLQRKAKLLGLEKLSWFDLDAPLAQNDTKISYDDGAKFIVEQFAKFGEKKASYAKLAFENQWIEAEDRPGKRPGGFHTYFPESGQSRIFMTYSGTQGNVSTLAHELGHGFHTYVMRDLPFVNRNYAMNVAETASTFAEMIVADAAVKNAKTKEEKLNLLEDKIQRSVAFFMNIHARFLFETRFYEERKKGMVTTERLNELMVEAQREAYGDALDEYHPMFWGSKLHFYITSVPFYNFPYTFGYLFSLGIYAEMLKNGNEEKYIALLRDTASMTVEDLAFKHLQVDLTKRDFWQKAVDLCIADVEEFLALTNE